MRKNEQGFTLIEMLVTVFIIATIAGLFMANYRAGERNSAVNLAANKLASDIRLAQSYAMSQTKYKTLPAREGWGVYLSSANGANTSYIIYSEQKPTSPDPINHKYDDGYSDEGYQQVDLPFGIEINLIDLDGASPATNDLSIGFEPPDPTVYFNDDPATYEKATITLLDTRTGTTREVVVNLVGLIDVE